MIYISDIISKDGVHVHSALRDGCELSFSDERFGVVCVKFLAIVQVKG